MEAFCLQHSRVVTQTLTASWLKSSVQSSTSALSLPADADLLCDVCLGFQTSPSGRSWPTAWCCSGESVSRRVSGLLANAQSGNTQRLFQDPACRHRGRVHLPARLHQHHGAAVPRGPPEHELLQRDRLHAFPGKAAAGADR